MGWHYHQADRQRLGITVHERDRRLQGRYTRQYLPPHDTPTTGYLISAPPLLPSLDYSRVSYHWSGCCSALHCLSTSLEGIGSSPASVSQHCRPPRPAAGSVSISCRHAAASCR